MKNTITLLSLSCILMAASCGKEKTSPIDTAKINFAFKAVFDGETLVLNDDRYQYKGNAIRFSKINFYIADLVAVNDDGETELTDIQFIDLTQSHNTEADARQGSIMTFSRVPVGAYNQLRFGVGVPADLNRTNPSDYSTTHPLGADNSGEYWEAWNSYIFAKIEGQYDVNGDGDINGDDLSFAYHTGMDSVYEPPIELDNIINLKAGETTELVFELDVRQLFTQPNGDLLTLKAHDPNNQLAEMKRIMQNFRKALQLKG